MVDEVVVVKRGAGEVSFFVLSMFLVFLFGIMFKSLPSVWWLLPFGCLCLVVGFRRQLFGIEG